MPIFDKKLAIYLAAILGIMLVAVLGIRFFSGEDNWICENGAWVRHGNPEGEPPNEACGVEITPLPTPPGGKVTEYLPDDKACLDRGGKVELRRRGDGEAYKICVLFGGKECEVSMFRLEECPKAGLSILGYKTQAARYCVDYGGTYKATQDRNYKTAKETGTCTFLSGKKCPALDFWNGKCLKVLPRVPPATEPVVLPINEDIYAFSALHAVQFSSDDALVKAYGSTPDAAFKKVPSFLTLIRRFIPGWNQALMAQGYPSVAATLPDGRKLFVFSGCSFDGCFGSLHVSAYDAKKKAMYLLAEDENRTEVRLYGVPDGAVRSALLTAYFSLW